MIERNIAETLRRLAADYPVVTVTGPRQSGKTTLCRESFPGKPWVSLEPLDTRRRAQSDPRGLLRDYEAGAIFDEVQHVPELLSYLQGVVDEDLRPGRFILTGSQHFGLSEAVSQSLAGRTGVLHLLPPAYDELQRFPDGPATLLETLWTGAYPAIFDRGIAAERWLADYVTTYVQRDVRQIQNITDLTAFATFVRLVAGRSAQVLNLSTLGADAGISHNTARAWLSVLEASFIAHRLPAWHRNINKRLTRAPKVHFYDTGLMCHLLGIRDPDQLRLHPLRGAVFETWVVAEVLKARLNAGQAANASYFRDHKGLEVDLVIERGDATLLVEAKSGATIGGDFLDPLAKVAELVSKAESWLPTEQRLIYGGDASQQRSTASVLGWRDIAGASWVA
ncbi:MAG: ATP-binding protein [Myxococcota bacterium]